MKQKKRKKKKERKGNALRIGFNINWPKYLFSRIFSLFGAIASEKNRLTRCFCKHRVHTDCFADKRKRGEDSKEREK